MIGLPKKDMPHPGEVLRDLYLDAKGWSQADLAREIGCPPKKVNQVVTGKSAISADFAIDIGEALGTSAQMWVRMQAEYDLFVAMRKRAASKRES